MGTSPRRRTRANVPRGTLAALRRRRQGHDVAEGGNDPHPPGCVPIQRANFFRHLARRIGLQLQAFHAKRPLRATLPVCQALARRRGQRAPFRAKFLQSRRQAFSVLLAFPARKTRWTPIQASQWVQNMGSNSATQNEPMRAARAPLNPNAPGRGTTGYVVNRTPDGISARPAANPAGR